MSRTTNTNPGRGRRSQYVEHHDHSKGPCDLLPFKEYMAIEPTKRWRSYHCHWSWDWVKGFDTRCSCDSCRQHIEAITKNKKQRREARELLKQYRAEEWAEF